MTFKVIMWVWLPNRPKPTERQRLEKRLEIDRVHAATVLARVAADLADYTSENKNKSADEARLPEKAYLLVLHVNL